MADDLTFRLRLIDEFSRPAQAARGALRELKAGAAEFGQGFRQGASEARTAADAVERDSQRMARGAESASKGGFNIASGLKMAAGAAAGLGLLEAAKEAVTFGMSTAAANEQAQISFTTLLGSGEKAKAFVGDLQQFAAKTPFEMAGLQQSASQMLAAGVSADKVIPIMTTLGNVTSGMGTGSEGIQRAVVALQQMNAAGKITGEDLNQLRDAGIPVYDLLASATGKSKEQVVELAQAGKLGKKELGQMMTALETGKGLERFNGLMEAQSNSLLGLWSSLKDNLGQGLGKLIDPAIPALKTGMKWLGDSIGSLPGLLSEWGGAIASNPFVKSLMEVGGKVQEAAKLLFGGNFSKGFREAFGVEEDAPIVDTILKIRDGAIGLYNLIVKGDFTGAFRRAFNMEEDNPIVGKILTIRDKVIELAGLVRDRVGPLWEAAWGAVQAGIERFVAIITWVWQNFGTTILNVISIAFGTMQGLISGAFTVITGIFGFFKALFTGDWAGMWEAVKQILSGVWTVITSILTGAWNTLIEVAGAAGGKLVEKFGEIVGWAVGKFEQLRAGIVSALRGFGTTMWNMLAVPAIDALNAVIDAANKIPGVSISAISTNSPFIDSGPDVSGLSRADANAARMSDTTTSMWRGGSISNTLAAYRAMGGGLGISNVWVGGGGRSYGSGDHQAGRALDLVGSPSQMRSFVGRANTVGDYAALHGSGASEHVHYVPRNDYAGHLVGAVRTVPGGMGDTSTSMARGGLYIASGAIVVNGAGDPSSVAEAVVARIERRYANAQERR